VTLRLPPSVNHAYRNVVRTTVVHGVPKRYTAQQLTPEAEVWLAECRAYAWQACSRTGWRCTADTKVVVELRVWWGDARVHDTHNLHKLVADGLEGVVYENDRYALLRDMDFDIDRTRPRLQLLWYVLGEA
jgi:crossover junction endodeoxyribonuclease RusA